MFDFLIKGATVYDGSLKPPKKCDVAIQKDKIAKVGLISEPARKTIDAKNLILAPGFIDIHSHSDYFLLIQPTADSHLTQGVTSEIGGNCGYSAAPIFGEAKLRREEEYQKYYNLKLGWQSLDEYFKRLEKTKIALNYGHLIGHNTLRQSVMGTVNRKATSAEIQKMIEALEEGLKQGAVGLSTGLIYPPACYADTEEVIELARVCQKYNAIFSFHMRSESDRLVEAVKEVLNVAQKTGVRVQISHLKTSGQRNWPKISKVFSLIEAAQKKGIDVQCDRYPYTASQTGLMQVLPEWTYEGGPEGLIQTLKDPEKRKRIISEIKATHPPEEDYFNKVLIMEVMSEKNKKYEGLTLSKAAETASMGVFEFLFQLLTEEKAAISAIYFTMSEDNLRQFFSKDYIFVASDSGCRAICGPLSKGKPHPRIFGTFPRVIRKYVKEEGVFTLSQAIHKMTLQPAMRFQIKNRGAVLEGYYADLVLFDFHKIKDLSDFLDPFHYAQGIQYVFVNGKLVLDQKPEVRECAGKIIRRAV